MTALNGNKLHRRFGLLLSLIALVSTSDAFCQSGAVLVKPDRTNTLFPGGNTATQFNARMSFWLELLEYAGFKVTIITEAGLVDLTNQSDILVLPGALCLNDREMESLHNYLQNNGGILATWGTGCRMENGEWRGYNFLQSILGSAPTNTEHPLNKPVAIQLRGGQPGTSAVPPGYRLKLIPDHVPLYLPQTDSVLTGGYWATTTYTEEIPDRIMRFTAFANRQLPQGGRFAWFGANLHTLHLDENNSEQYRAVFNRLFRWLSGEGLAAVESWPRGKPAAVLVHGDVIDQFNSVERLSKEF